MSRHLTPMQRFLIFLLSLVTVFSCARLKPLPEALVEADTGAKKQDPKLVYRFFDDAYAPGGFDYIYPDDSRIFIPEESGHESDVALQFDLVADDYSGGSVCLYNMLYNLETMYSRGALQFWIKGNQGGEIAWAGLVDEENSDGKKTVVRLPIGNYGGISNEWQQITIPFADFGKRGVYWDAKKRVEVPNPFDWDKVSEFRIEIKKADNEKFRVWVDDIFLMRDMFEPAQEVDEDYWDDIKEIIPAPPLDKQPEVNVVASLFKDDNPAGAFLYVYGGKTAHKIQPTDNKKNPGVLAMYQDGSEYSGVTLALGNGNNVDLSSLRSTTAGIAFWAKGGTGVEKAYVGLLDDESDGRKTQTKVSLGDFGQLDTNWNYFMIPVKQFSGKGKYWDAAKKAEILADVQWKQINEFRISIGRMENKIKPGQPVKIYLDEISVIDKIPGYVDPELFWAAFKSDAPDLMLHDFETARDQRLESSGGPKSKVAFKFIKPPAGGKQTGGKSLHIDYYLGDWCDVVYHYKINGDKAERRDWTRHWGLKFSLYTEKPYQAVTVQVSDRGNEIFVSNVGGTKGWNELLVPFKRFSKFPYYQPPDAVQDAKFDLDNIISIDFKPSGEGSKGWFLIDNVQLTNTREIKKAPARAMTTVAVKGDLGKTLTQKINPGIFGINVALWDGDFFEPKTEEYVKSVNHGVLRYPGGLRADEDHWEEVLKKKDWMVDTDEYMDFCKKTNTEAMITVNFGTGTPQEAAKWVVHTKERGDNVRLWEVGNELYGDWHANHCTADEYGKRAAEFIKAMKAADPSIKVAVVWVLEGQWNETVFKHTKDLADAVIIHHYPQHAGEENDFALLSSAATLDNIIPGVREQVKKWGNPGKKYEIWLTEWNSVDFKPGPQTLSIVNALFVADYLGTLAKHNIEHADYWDVHNDMTPQGGDYGYLSRTGAPDGDNTPRPSYWAFKLASEAVRGRLASCKTDNDNVACFLNEHEDGGKALMLINKLPQTKAKLKLSVSGLKGSVTMKQLTKESGPKGFSEKKVNLDLGLTLPPYSLTVLRAGK